MDHFDYRENRLFAEDVELAAIAEQTGTPCYVYSRATLERHWQAFDRALSGHDHLVCYAVKANSNLAVLQILATLGSGFDIVSGGELERVLRAGGDPAKVVFSGVGKTLEEMRRALAADIRVFNVESRSELHRLNDVAGECGKTAPVSLRVNPDVDANTHPYIATGLRDNKFGITIDRALDAYQAAAELSNVRISGVDCHIGSQLTKLAPFVDALQRILALVDRLQATGIELQHINLGGGLGIRYCEKDNPPQPEQYAQALLEQLGDRSLDILIEPGRTIAGNAGVLLTRVEYIKQTESKNFAIVDAAMNDLARPSLYDAWHDIVPVQPRAGPALAYDIVGPVCETGDFLGKDRVLNLVEGDLLAVRSAGAYGFTMSSNYNTRPRAAEVMVDGSKVHVVRERETIDSLLINEHLLDG
jgi:diaminopimelate decarboxylase